MKETTVLDCLSVQLPKVHDKTGSIVAINNGEDVPFEVRRVYYLYDVPGGGTRGGHAHRRLRQLIVAGSGSFDVIVDDGRRRKSVTLNRPNHGLLITPGIWRELVNFSAGAVCIVLASRHYDEADYIRDYDTFQASISSS